MKRFLFMGLAVAMLMQSAVFASDVASDVVIETDDFEDTDTVSSASRAAKSNVNSSSDITSEDLKKALSYIKSVINIPDEFDDMSYEVYDNELEVSWDNSTKGNDFLTVTYDLNGKILSYRHVGYDYGKPDLEKVKNLQQAGETFIKNILGDDFKYFKLDKKVGDHNGMTFVYKQYFNSVLVDDATVMVSVSTSTGEVTSFTNNMADLSLLKKEDSVIPLETAKQKYIENLGMDLHYTRFYGDDGNKNKAVPVYTLATSGKYIDAVTGDVVTKSEEMNDSGAMKNSMSAVAYDSTEEAEEDYSNLTEKEIEKTEEIDGLIGVDKAVAIIKNAFPIAKNDKLKSSDIKKTVYSWYRNTSSGNDDASDYYYNLNFEKSYATVNAKTGDIISFNYYYGRYANESKTPVLTEEKVLTKVKETLDKVFLLDKSNLGEPEVNVNQYGASVNYTRVCNGLEFSQNSVQFSIDNDGNVTRYNKNWDKVEFEPVNNIVTDKNAFDEFDKWKNYSLKYVYNYKTKSYKLVYDFIQSESFNMVNAITGKAVNYNGVEYTKKSDGVYTDISDHWCKEIVETLALMDIKLDGNEFRPDDPITKRDFAALLDSYYTYSSDDGDDYMTRYDAAEYVCGDVLGFKILKDKDELFVQPFEDVDEEHYAEVAFLKGLGMVNDAKDFNGEKLLTRAEAASMVYNAIKNHSLN